MEVRILDVLIGTAKEMEELGSAAVAFKGFVPNGNFIIEDNRLDEIWVNFKQNWVLTYRTDPENDTKQLLQTKRLTNSLYGLADKVS